MNPCLVVGILNCTPDSFSEVRRHLDPETAIAAGLAMAAAGADWIDVGGESTRPGALAVSAAEEMRRVIPVIAGLAARVDAGVRISVDTYKAETARAAVSAGARVINDVSGGRLDPDILSVAAETGVAIVLGHLRGRPATMMDEIVFDDVVSEVTVELAERVAEAHAAGCVEVWADPGIGFGKRIEHNLALLRRLPQVCRGVGAPIMVGVSRKAFIGQLTNRPVAERQFGTAAAVAAAVWGGVAAVRVHDAGPMRDVVRVAEALRPIGFA